MEQKDMLTCGLCKYWKPSFEFKGLGSCQNEQAHRMMFFISANLIIGYCDNFFFSNNFGCIFGEKSEEYDSVPATIKGYVEKYGGEFLREFEQHEQEDVVMLVLIPKKKATQNDTIS